MPVHPAAAEVERREFSRCRPVTVNFRCQTSRNPGSRRLERRRIIHGSSRTRETWGMTPPRDHDFATIVRDAFEWYFQKKGGASEFVLFIHGLSQTPLSKLFREEEID